MAAGDLVTNPAALAWLNMTSDPNGTIAGLVTAISTAIQSWLGYNIASASYTNNFNGDGGRALIIPDRPLTAISSLVMNGNIIVPAQSLPQTFGYSFNESTVYLSGWYRFPRGFQNIAVSYTAGYSSVPADIAQACLDWVKIALSNQSFDANVTEFKAAGTMFKRDVSKTDIPDGVAALLQPYRLVF